MRLRTHGTEVLNVSLLPLESHCILNKLFFYSIDTSVSCVHKSYPFSFFPWPYASTSSLPSIRVNNLNLIYNAVRSFVRSFHLSDRLNIFCQLSLILFSFLCVLGLAALNPISDPGQNILTGCIWWWPFLSKFDSGTQKVLRNSRDGLQRWWLDYDFSQKRKFEMFP